MTEFATATLRVEIHDRARRTELARLLNVCDVYDLCDVYYKTTQDEIEDLICEEIRNNYERVEDCLTDITSIDGVEVERQTVLMTNEPYHIQRCDTYYWVRDMPVIIKYEGDEVVEMRMCGTPFGNGVDEFDICREAYQILDELTDDFDDLNQLQEATSSYFNYSTWLFTRWVARYYDTKANGEF